MNGCAHEGVEQILNSPFYTYSPVNVLEILCGMNTLFSHIFLIAIGASKLVNARFIQTICIVWVMVITEEFSYSILCSQSYTKVCVLPAFRNIGLKCVSCAFCLTANNCLDSHFRSTWKYSPNCLLLYAFLTFSFSHFTSLL